MKIENHMHAVALDYMHYNFCRIHKTLRCTPAMEAGVPKTLWSIEDIVALLGKQASKFQNPCPDARQNQTFRQFCLRYF